MCVNSSFSPVQYITSFGSSPIALFLKHSLVSHASASHVHHFLWLLTNLALSQAVACLARERTTRTCGFNCIPFEQYRLSPARQTCLFALACRRLEVCARTEVCGRTAPCTEPELQPFSDPHVTHAFLLFFMLLIAGILRCARRTISTARKTSRFRSQSSTRREF